MMDGRSKETLFISIASYKDTQLIPTIQNALDQAKDPTRIYFAIIEQDDVSKLEEIKKLIKQHGAGLYYEYYLPDKSYGVVWARAMAHKYLKDSMHDYYLQIDSHTRFILHYDSFLINEYKHAKEYWGDFVWVASLPDYEYDPITKISKLQNDRPHTVLDGLLDISSPSKIKTSVKQWSYHPYGELANHTCGQFIFGDSRYIIDHPHDPNLYWDGEESTYGARLYCSGIKTVSMPKIYAYHLYDDGSRNTRQRPGDARHVMLSQNGIKRCNDFWEGKIKGIYGVSSVEKLNEYLYNTGRETWNNV